MILERIAIACDLSDSSLSYVRDQILGSENHILYVSPANIETAERLLRVMQKIKYKLDTDLPRDAWYVIGEFSGVFSPGA